MYNDLYLDHFQCIKSHTVCCWNVSRRVLAFQNHRLFRRLLVCAAHFIW